jgi:hypothetical protein
MDFLHRSILPRAIRVVLPVGCAADPDPPALRSGM